MASMTKVKQVSLSQQIVDYIDMRTKDMGIGFPEYIRYLVLKDKDEYKETIPYISEEEEKRIDEAMKEYKRGDYVTLRNKKEIHEHYLKLLDS